MAVETDYLVVGAGASGVAFVDTLVAEADVEVTLVDRQAAAGGHWLHAYPFLRLHTPSAFYGVNSLALGADRIDEAGENAGYYERATGSEVSEYFQRAAAELVRTGRVRLLTGHEYVNGDGGRVRNMATHEVQDVVVRRRIVDARYLEASIPATHAPPFEVAADVRLVPVNELPASVPASSYTVLGSGKTAADACFWLLNNGVEPDRIRWIRPRDAWFYDRRHFQPLQQVGAIMEGLSLDAEVGARAGSLGEIFEQLEAVGRFVRVDPSRRATMFRGTMLSAGELQAIRQIADVVRLGRVRRIETDRILLEQGETETNTDVLHVDCTALGLNNAPATPIFQPGRIVLQQVRYLSPCFNAALIGYVEARRDEDADKNRLCPPNPYPSTVQDWPRMMSRTWETEAGWLKEPDVSAWVAASRLNLIQALPDHLADPSVQVSVKRYVTHVTSAIERLSSVPLGGSRPAS